MPSPTPPRQLQAADLQDALRGACVLGAGGGGPWSIGQALVERMIQLGKPLLLAAPGDVPDTAWMAVSAVIGSPTAAEGGAFPYEVPGIAFNALEQTPGQERFSYVLAAELGAGNSMIPLMVAQERGIPMVDADGAGRAIPAIPMVTYATGAGSARVSPFVLANSQQSVSCKVDSPSATDATIRGIISSGSWTEDAGLALWAMPGQLMKQLAVPGTFTYAMGLGAALREALAAHADPVEAVRAYLDGWVLFRGKVASSGEKTSGGFDFGSLVLDAIDGSDEQCRIYNQNENLIMWTSKRRTPVAMMPDLICFLTTDGQPFSNADLNLAQGKEVAVLGARCRPELRGLELLPTFAAALQTLGYGGPYVPIEDLQESTP